MKNVDYTKIGARVRADRVMQRITQEEVSGRCDITSSYYGNIERDDKKMSVETLVKIAKGLNASADELLFGETTKDLGEAEIHCLSDTDGEGSWSAWLNIKNTPFHLCPKSEGSERELSLL